MDGLQSHRSAFDVKHCNESSVFPVLTSLNLTKQRTDSEIVWRLEWLDVNA